ncbi:MAG: hypothetical protein F4Y16_07925 [Holophagales bacterium]|nr:hypothetical protein [Holophagales bacterium]MYH26695.1 hypothetical protein [Holophagales bacterium]
MLLDLNLLSVVVGLTSLVLALVTILLSLHNRSKAEEWNQSTRETFLDVEKTLQQIRIHAETIQNHAFQQADKVFDAVAFQQVDRTYTDSQKGQLEVPIKAPTTAAPPPKGAPEEATGELEPEPTPEERTLEEFRVVVNRMDEGTKFTGNDRDVAFGLVSSIRKSDVKHAPEFEVLLERLLDNLMAADQNAHIDVIDDWFGAMTTENRGINNTILQNLGHRLLGSTAPARDRDIRRFKRHMDAAGHGNDPLARCIWIVYNFVQENSEELERTFAIIEAFDAAQTLSFLDVLDRYCEESRIAKSATEKIKAMASNARGFRSAYKRRLAEVRERVR